MPSYYLGGDLFLEPVGPSSRGASSYETKMLFNYKCMFTMHDRDHLVPHAAAKMDEGGIKQYQSLAGFL